MMKSPLAIAALAACAAVFSGLMGAESTGAQAAEAKSTPAPAAEATAVVLRVDQYIKSDMNPKDRISRTHARTVNAIITNNSSESLQVKVKHVVFGRDMHEHQLVTVGEGENPATVKPHMTERIQTAEAKVIGTEQHWDPKAKKMIPASGANIVGIGVQVLQGSTVVAEFFDPPSLKEHWGKTQPLVFTATPAPAAKPAAIPAATPAATPAKK